MNAPLIFIVFPIAIGALLALISRKVLLSSLLAAGLCLALAVLAGILPVGQFFLLGSSRVEIPAEWSILGRQFVLAQTNLPVLVLLFGMGAFWFLGIRPASAPRRMPSIGMILLGLAVSALAVRPFLYAAILIEAMVLVSVPLLIQPGQAPGRGVVRYIIFLTLAVPFILLAGALAGKVDQNPAEFTTQVILLLGIGFSLWLAVFPLSTWVPMLAEETPPFVSGFVLNLLSMSVLLLLVSFINEFGWLRNFPNLSVILRSAGIVMIAASGVWALFQKNLTRLFGLIIVMQNGFALLTISLLDQPATQLFSTSLLPRLLGMAVLGISLAGLRKAGVELSETGISGLVYRHPVLVIAMLFGVLSLTGLPLLASFPGWVTLFERLADTALTQLLWVGIGVLGLFGAGMRLIAASVQSESAQWQIEEDRLLAAMLIIGVILLLVMGLFPTFSLGWMTSLL